MGNQRTVDRDLRGPDPDTEAWLSEKPRRDTLGIHNLYALVLTSLVFVLGFWLFSIQEPEPTETEASHAPVVAVVLGAVPAEDAPEEKRQQQRELQNAVESWLDLLDPTIMSLTNLKHGFSSIMDNSSAMPFLPYVTDEVTIEAMEMPPAERTQIVEPPSEDLDSLLPNHLAIAADFPAPANNRLQPTEPAITDLQGRILKDMPPIAPESYTDLELKVPATQSTILEIIPSGDILRVRVTQSSGSPQLDVIAMQHLKQAVRPLPDIQKSSEYVQSWLAKTHHVVVHWRFAASLRNAIDTTADGESLDHPWF